MLLWIWRQFVVYIPDAYASPFEAFVIQIILGTVAGNILCAAKGFYDFQDPVAAGAGNVQVADVDESASLIETEIRQ